MIRVKTGAALAISALLLTVPPASADVKVQQKSQVKFEGMLGKMMNFFGGKAAREGVVQTVVVQGDRRATLSEDAGEIVDLAEEKVYELNLKDKSYKVKTFAEIRQEMEKAAREAEKEAREGKDEGGREMEVEFDIKNTGQAKTINGFPCNEVVTTITVHEKGKTLEQAGGIVMTANSWLAPSVAGAKEMTDFDMRYAKKLMGGAAGTQQLIQAFAMYPGMKEAMARFETERANLEGTPIQTVMTLSSAMTPEQAQAASREEGERSGGGGVVGGVLGRFGRRKAPETKEPPKAGASTDRKTIMTSITDLLSISQSVNVADLQVPAGFKLKK